MCALHWTLATLELALQDVASSLSALEFSRCSVLGVLLIGRVKVIYFRFSWISEIARQTNECDP
jgi:hypothetical protein